MLQIIRVAGKAAANPQAGIDLELAGSVGMNRVGRVDPFDRSWPFPGKSPVAGVRVDSLRT